MPMRIVLLSVLFLCLAPAANSIEKRTIEQEGLLDLEDEWGQIWQPAPTPPGALAWNTLIKVKIKKKSVGDPYYDIPIITSELREIDGKTVKLNGYMVPLDATELQGHFILMAYPHSCPFHVPGGLGGFVEVQADFPVEFTYEPVLIEGHFQLLTDYSEGLFYRISAARAVK